MPCRIVGFVQRLHDCRRHREHAGIAGRHDGDGPSRRGLGQCVARAPHFLAVVACVDLLLRPERRSHAHIRFVAEDIFGAAQLLARGRQHQGGIAGAKSDDCEAAARPSDRVRVDRRAGNRNGERAAHMDRRRPARPRAPDARPSADPPASGSATAASSASAAACSVGPADVARSATRQATARRARPVSASAASIDGVRSRSVPAMPITIGRGWKTSSCLPGSTSRGVTVIASGPPSSTGSRCLGQPRRSRRKCARLSLRADRR